MSGTYVTDITHYLDDDGELPTELPSPARKLASFLVLVIDEVTQQLVLNTRDSLFVKPIAVDWEGTA